jgi:hypothetical protein
MATMAEYAAEQERNAEASLNEIAHGRRSYEDFDARERTALLRGVISGQMEERLMGLVRSREGLSLLCSDAALISMEEHEAEHTRWADSTLKRYGSLAVRVRAQLDLAHA